jgi:arabinan endo-1,5-alpha-L-arabinosidase
MVGRSEKITGPYLDEKGSALMEGGGTAVLTGNQRWLGPGGESIFHQTGGEGDVMVFHAYAAGTGNPSLQISTIDWSGGWPHVALEGNSP